MNWEAVGAIGELLGAAAVVITLVYLGLQVRLTRRTIISNTQQNISDSSVHLLSLSASSDRLSEAIAKALAGDRLNSEEATRV